MTATTAKKAHADGHPGFEALADLADGRLPASGKRTVEAHAASCEVCGVVLDGIREVKAHLAAGGAAEPTRAALRKALGIPRGARVAAAAAAVRTFVARLVFDSLSGDPSPALALRGGATRQLLYEAGPYDLELSRVEGALRGSLVPRKEGEGTPQPTGGTAALYRGGRRTAGAFLDSRGRFAIIEGLPGGSYEIRLETGWTVIRVPSVEL